MDIQKKRISLIIEILLIISIILAILSIFFKGIALDKNTYTNILDKNNTYEQVKESVYNKVDALLNAKNINFDIKESIITVDDIKRESDSMIYGVIQYLKTGKNDIKPIDSELYKQRVKAIISNVIKPTTKDLTFNSNVQIENTVSIKSEMKFNNLITTKEKSKAGQSSMKVEKLMTQSEAEAKVRDILKQKGLTEEQAIQKATEKGITEQQALGMLAGYGITIDDKSDSEKSEVTSGNSDNSNNSSIQESDSTAEKTENKEASSNNKTENTINQTPKDKSIENPLDVLINKLTDQAGISIDKEVEKINSNKVLESSEFKKLTQITSVIYKMFWIFMILPIIFIMILIMINNKDFNSRLIYIRSAFLLSGLILFTIFFGIYVSKVYDKLDISTVYLKDVIVNTIKHFLIVLSAAGISTGVIGLVMTIPALRKKSKQV